MFTLFNLFNSEKLTENEREKVIDYIIQYKDSRTPVHG